MAELAERQIAFIEHVFGGTLMVKDSLTTIKERIHAMHAQGTVDWPTILDALEILTDALIAAQPHGPPAPEGTSTLPEGTSEKEQADDSTTQ